MGSNRESTQRSAAHVEALRAVTGADSIEEEHVRREGREVLVCFDFISFPPVSSLGPHLGLRPLLCIPLLGGL